MAIIPKNEFIGRTIADDPDYPQGKATDVINNVVGTGTPLGAKWVNDDWGFKQALLDEVGITPSGLEDKVGTSDYLDAVKRVAKNKSNSVTLAEAIADSSAKEGDTVFISDRNGLFEYKTGQVDNTFNIVACTGVAGFSLVLAPSEIITLKQLGAKEDAKGDGIEDGTTDDTDVVKFAALLSKKIVITNKVMVSESIPNTSKWVGDLDYDTSQVVVKPAAVVNKLFDCHNVKEEILFSRLGFIGNGLGVGGGIAGAISVTMDSAMLYNVERPKVDRCYFENFIHNSWINFFNSSTLQLSNPSVTNCRFESRPDNDVDPSNIGVPATCIAFQGNVSDLLGTVLDIKVANNYADCRYMKRFCDIWGQVRGGGVKGNNIRYCGQNTPEGKGSYGILAYTSRYLTYPLDPLYAYDPTRVNIYNNIIEEPRDCGLYLVGLTESSVYGNTIFGQYGTDETTLSKGGIVTNGAHNLNVYDNILYDNYRDISLAQTNYLPDRDIEIFVHNNACGSQCRITPHNNTAETYGYKSTIHWEDNNVKGQVEVLLTNLSENTDLYIKGGSIKNATNALYIRQASVGTPASGKPVNIVVDGVEFADIAGGINFTIATTGINLDIMNSRFDLLTTTGTAIDISGSKNVTFNNNHFWASSAIVGTQRCIDLTGAEYTSRGNTTKGINIGQKAYGFVAPSWSAVTDDRVQVLEVTQEGDALSKYVTLGYIYVENSAAWVEERIVTGN